MINGGNLLNNSISISNVPGLLNTNNWSSATNGSITISALPHSNWETDPDIKRYQVLEIKKDLLALSCAWQRIRAEHEEGQVYITITKLTDPSLFNKLTQEDHVKAAKIRDYYSKKIMLWKLKGESLSKFREDMNLFIHTDGKIFKEDMMPLAYRLPEFYDYDIDFDMLSNEYNKKVSQGTQNEIGGKLLKLVKTFVVSKKHRKQKEYWFRDDNNDLVSLSISFDNPLLSLLDICTQGTIKVNAIYTKKSRDNNEYLVANKFKFG